jgi:hypothetical protein
MFQEFLSLCLKQGLGLNQEKLFKNWLRTSTVHTHTVLVNENTYIKNSTQNLPELHLHLSKKGCIILSRSL